MSRISDIIEDIKEQYLEEDNNIPWIIGFSGGKDSTTVLTLVWRALLFVITKTKCYEIQNEMRLGSQVIYQNEM